jgi:hypothetical protein
MTVRVLFPRRPRASSFDRANNSMSRHSSASWDDTASIKTSRPDGTTQTTPSVISSTTGTDDDSKSAQAAHANMNKGGHKTFKHAADSFLKTRKHTSSMGDYDVEAGVGDAHPSMMHEHRSFLRKTAKHEGESLYVSSPRTYRELNIEVRKKKRILLI